MLEGGEPTLHPDLDEILDILIQYKEKYNKQCNIMLCTNGYGEKAQKIISKPPEGLSVQNSLKSPDLKNDHFPFNIAPADLPEFSGAYFSEGCYIHHLFGLGLTRNGYYPHPVCGGIDRVFGLDIGLKKLPGNSYELEDQMLHLCRFCGHFREFYSVNGNRSSIFKHRGDSFAKKSRSGSWKKAYNSFKKEPPELTLY